MIQFKKGDRVRFNKKFKSTHAFRPHPQIGVVVKSKYCGEMLVKFGTESFMWERKWFEKVD